MSTYAVGDIQGCFEPLQRLLAKVAFDPSRDRLWCVGDLVNRGPASLETLRYLRGLGASAICVLGNHDLHCVAVARGVRPPRKKDTFDALLAAPDRDELVAWLRGLPLFHRDSGQGLVMVHAGLAPEWTLDDAERYSAEVVAALAGPSADSFLRDMYGLEPRRFTEELTGTVRLRTITNVMTRMRYLHADGSLDFDTKCHPDDAPDDLVPWFDFPGRKSTSTRLVFGHWALLRGEVDRADVMALDTGCAWGNTLTLACLETGIRTSVPCTRADAS